MRPILAGATQYWERRLPNIGGILQKDIQFYHAWGFPRCGPCRFIDDTYLNVYLSLIFQYGNLLWNPEADLKAGLRDFCRHYLGMRH